MNGGGENAAGVDGLADPREEIALQIEKVADQFIRVRKNGELAALEVDEMSLDGEIRRLRPEQADGDAGRIGGGDAPAEAGEIQGVASGAAGEVERTPGREPFGGLDEERVGVELTYAGSAKCWSQLRATL